MGLTWDEGKRRRTFLERGLDMAKAQQIFDGDHLSEIDNRFDYGEERIITFGFLMGRLCAVVWTLRGDDRRIISMRKANAGEQEKFKNRMGRSG